MMNILLLALLFQNPNVDAQLKALRGAVDALEAALKPTPARVVVRTATELQAALDAATSGQTIALAPGEYIGTFLLRAKPLTDFVTITTDGLTLPNARVSSGAGMATLRSATNTPDVQTEPGAHHYRFVGINFGPTRNGEDDMVRIGNSEDPDPAHVPFRLEFDQCYGAGGVNGQRRAIAANGAHITIQRSRFENIWKAGQDSQAIAIWSGPGPLLVLDNYLEAASENVLVGGTPPASAAQLPADIVVFENDIVKRKEWKGILGRNFKNLFELKFGKRIRALNNRLSGNWPQAQSGYAVLFTVATNVSGLPGCPYCVLEDVLFEFNTIRDVAMCFQILGSAYSSPSGNLDGLAIRNNLCAASRTAWGGNGMIASLEGGPKHVMFDRNTLIMEGSANSFINATLGQSWPPGAPAPVPAIPPSGLVFRGNVVHNGSYGVFTPTGANGVGLAWFGDAVIEDNVIIGAPATAKYPASNIRVPTGTAVYDPATFAILPAFAGHGKGTE